MTIKVDMSREIWEPIKWYEGFYEVSNYGRVRSLERTARFVSKCGKESIRRVRARDIACTVGKKSGRVSVMLCKYGERKRIALHRLVGEAFVDNPNPNEYTEINHIDENPQNNRADNLEWCNRQYNMTYGKMKEMYASHRRPIIASSENATMYFCSIKAAVNAGADRYKIMYALKNGNTVYGFKWRYADGKQPGKRGIRRAFSCEVI